MSKLPRWLSYGLGDTGAWLAHRLLTGTTNGLIDNFRAVFPGESDDALRRLAALTYRTYARDVVDFIRALSLDARRRPARCSPPMPRWRRTQAAA